MNEREKQLEIGRLSFAGNIAPESEPFPPEVLAKVEEIRRRVRSGEEKLYSREEFKAWTHERILKPGG